MVLIDIMDIYGLVIEYIKNNYISGLVAQLVKEFGNKTSVKSTRLLILGLGVRVQLFSRCRKTPRAHFYTRLETLGFFASFCSANSLNPFARGPNISSPLGHSKTISPDTYSGLSGWK